MFPYPIFHLSIYRIMKPFLLSLFLIPIMLLLLVNPPTTAQTLVTWEAPTPVADASYDNIRPRAEVLGDGTPIVMWGHGNEIYVSTKKANEETFNEPVLVNTGTINPYVGSVEGPTIATHDNSVFVAFDNGNFSQGGVFMVKSEDGGQTFGVVLDIPAPVGTEPILVNIASTDTGNPIASYIALGGSGPTYQVVNTTTDGSSFLEPVTANTAAAGGIVCECCPSTIVTQGETQVLLFRNNNDNIRDMWATKSTDNGATFTEATDIDWLDWYIEGCPVTGPDGVIVGNNLVSVWMSAGSGSSRVYASTVNLATMELGDYTAINSEVAVSVNQNFPRIAVSPSNEVLCMVWQERNEDGWDVYFTWSATGVNDLPNHVERISSVDGNQTNPDITFSNGYFHIFYEDDLTNQLQYTKAKVWDFTTTNSLSPQNHTVQVSPNPFKNNTQIQFHNPQNLLAEIKTYHINGKLVHNTTTYQNKYLFNRKELATGVYLLAVKVGGEIAVKKIIVE